MVSLLFFNRTSGNLSANALTTNTRYNHRRQPERARAALLARLLMASVPDECVTVTPVRSIVTSSVGPGSQSGEARGRVAEPIQRHVHPL
jgi:hypothetical protein